MHEPRHEFSLPSSSSKADVMKDTRSASPTRSFNTCGIVEYLNRTVHHKLKRHQKSNIRNNLTTIHHSANCLITCINDITLVRFLRSCPLIHDKEVRRKLIYRKLTRIAFCKFFLKMLNQRAIVEFT